MSRFQNILVYAEAADDASFEQIVALAREQGARLSVCDVITPPPAVLDSEGTVSRLKAVNWELAFEGLRTLCAPHSKAIDIDYTVLTGVPFLAVTEQVMQQGFDLVVHLSPQPESAGLNPTGMHLMRKCPSAVWSLPVTSAPRRPANIVIAVDRNLSGSGATTDALVLAQTAAASSVAAGDGARLHLVHGWRPYGEEWLSHCRADLSAEEIERYVAAQARDHELWFSALAETLAREVPDCVIEQHLRRGHGPDVVASLVAETGADLVVMGTIGTSIVPGVLIGTSAEAILSRTRTSVLALKPTSFTSPLRFGSTPIAGAFASDATTSRSTV
ncbi:MAG: universal stress protein [Pseudomonadota bacterium]